MSRRGVAGPRPADVGALALFLALGVVYLSGLGRYLINDDEGSYLYAAWRISLGDLPYLDFLTPQLPAFLLPGGWLMRLAGPDVELARGLAVLATLGAAILLWLTVRHLLGSVTALLAAALLLLHPDVFLELRTYRPEPFMLVFSMAGLALFVWAVLPTPDRFQPPNRWRLAAAGCAFGLATLAKLFGPFVMAGAGLWLVADAVRRRRPAVQAGVDLAVLGAAAAAVVVLGLGVFAMAGADVYTSVLGHHLVQGGGVPMTQVVAKGAAFFVDYLRHHALLAFGALAVAVLAWRENDRGAAVFLWQLPTALAFLVLSRELFGRHLVYLVPALASLFAVGAVRLARRSDSMAKGWGLAVVMALALPWMLTDRDVAWRQEDGTRRLATFIGLTTADEAVVLSDFSEINFYARRPTSFSAASLSAGAAGSGQITWERMRRELMAGAPDGGPQDSDHQANRAEGSEEPLDWRPDMVLVDRTQVEGREYGHLRFLRDVDAFETWLTEHYRQIGVFVRRLELPDRQIHAVYVPETTAVSSLADYDGGPELLAGAVAHLADRPPRVQSLTEPGPTAGLVDRAPGFAVRLWPERHAAQAPQGYVVVDMAWRGAATDSILAATARLVGPSGEVVAAYDQALTAAGPRTTLRWLEDEVTAMSLAFPVPPGTPPGDYDVRLGVYRQPGSGPGAGPPGSVPELMSARGYPDGAVPIGTVEVPAWRAAPGDVFQVAPDAVPVTPDPSATYGALVARGPLPEVVEAGGSVEFDLWFRGLYAGAGLRVVLGDPATGALAGEVPLAPSQLPGVEDLVIRRRVELPVAAGTRGETFQLLAIPEDVAGQDPPIPLGQVTIRARGPTEIDTQIPELAVPVGVTFGARAELVGVAEPAPSGEARTWVAEPGGQLPLELVWRAREAIPARYKVTVQAVRPNGEPVVQHDSEPADWTRPTTTWLPGEVIRDLHRLQVGPNVPLGTYPLLVALYDAAGERLPADGRDAVEIGFLRIAED